MESEYFLIHRRYENFINYINETNQSKISAFDNWIKKETQVIDRKKENNIKSTKIECVFCFKEVARQNISFHYDSCSGAQFFNYMQGGIFKARHSCQKCGKNFLKKHRNRHSCDVKKKEIYSTCKYCGFNFLYHKKCRVHDIVLEYNRFNKIIEIVDDSNEERPKKIRERREVITKDLGMKVSLDACAVLINTDRDEGFFVDKPINSKSNSTEPNQQDINMLIADSERANKLNIAKKDSFYDDNCECLDEQKENMIENKEKNMIDLEFRQDKIKNQIKAIQNESSKEEKISKCNLIHNEMLKIAKMEIEIMLNFKKWFDIMRTDAVNNNQVESYREELNHINCVISNLHVQRKIGKSIDGQEEKLLQRKRIKFSVDK